MTSLNFFITCCIYKDTKCLLNVSTGLYSKFYLKLKLTQIVGSPVTSVYKNYYKLIKRYQCFFKMKLVSIFDYFKSGEMKNYLNCNSSKLKLHSVDFFLKNLLPALQLGQFHAHLVVEIQCWAQQDVKLQLSSSTRFLRK